MSRHPRPATNSPDATIGLAGCGGVTMGLPYQVIDAVRKGGCG